MRRSGYQPRLPRSCSSGGSLRGWTGRPRGCTSRPTVRSGAHGPGERHADAGNALVSRASTGRVQASGSTDAVPGPVSRPWADQTPPAGHACSRSRLSTPSEAAYDVRAPRAKRERHAEPPTECRRRPDRDRREPARTRRKSLDPPGPRSGHGAAVIAREDPTEQCAAWSPHPLPAARVRDLRSGPAA